MSNATHDETMPASPADVTDPAISPADVTLAERQPEKPLKRTVSGIDRNIEGCVALIDRLKAKIKAHKGDVAWDKDGDTVKSLNKTLANLEERLAILRRLRDQQVKYDDR